MKDGTAVNVARADVNSLPSPPSNAPLFAPLLQPPLFMCVPRSPELAPGGTELAGSPLVRGSRVLHLSLAGSERKARLGVSSYYLLQVRVRLTTHHLRYHSPLTIYNSPLPATYCYSLFVAHDLEGALWSFHLAHVGRVSAGRAGPAPSRPRARKGLQHITNKYINMTVHGTMCCPYSHNQTTTLTLSPTLALALTLIPTR